MKTRALLALLATVLTTAACADSITGPKLDSTSVRLESSDSSANVVGDGPLWGSGN